MKGTGSKRFLPLRKDGINSLVRIFLSQTKLMCSPLIIEKHKIRSMTFIGLACLEDYIIKRAIYDF
jgi:hypothetical protein